MSHTFARPEPLVRSQRWEAKVKLSNGALHPVTVDANNSINARLVLVQLYGQGNIFSGPTQITT